MDVEIFELSDEYIELNKLLKATGLCGSGGEAKIFIESGAVKVDGEVEHRKRRKLRDGTRVEFDSRTIRILQKDYSAQRR